MGLNTFGKLAVVGLVLVNAYQVRQALRNNGSAPRSLALKVSLVGANSGYKPLIVDAAVLVAVLLFGRA